MIFCKKYFAYIFLSIVLHTTCSAQLFTKLGDQHNQFFVGSGYSQCYGNITYGINHARYFKIIKRDVIGIIDFSSPLYYKYYTRFVFRKGFQFDICRKNNFKLPIAIISSTIKKHFSLFNFHDIITGVSVLPGIYTDKYTIAVNMGIDFLWLHKVHYNDVYYNVNSPRPNPANEKINLNIGIVLAYNLQRFSFILKGGFQQITHWEFTKEPIYAVGILAFKLNFRKHIQPEAKNI